MLCAPVAVWAQKFELRGVVRAKDDHRPIAQALVEIPTYGLWAIADNQGAFSIEKVPQKKIVVGVSCLGYVGQTFEINIEDDASERVFYLEEQTLKVESVTVVAHRKTETMSTSRLIGSTALAHQQILDASNVASLLPGGKTVNPDLLQPHAFSLRDGGYDVGNSAFGTAVEVDGVRLSTNASIGKVTGVDTRNLAASAIESVEVITGVPSAEYGDIASGLVKINMRKGRTPYMASFTTNPRTKQFALSKGFDLGEKRGVLNTNVEYTRATKDPVSPYTSYSRTGVSLLYRNALRQNLRFDFGVTGNIGGMNTEDDPDAQNGEWMRAHDHVFRAQTALKWQLNKKWITNLDFKASLDYNDQYERECQHITQGSPSQAVHALEKGYFMADILPANYFTYRNVDSKQLNYAAELKATWIRKWRGVRSQAKMGVAWRADGNVGQGAYYDDELLSPNGYRPYPYRDIPYLHNLAVYLEDVLTLPVGRGKIDLMAGLRIEQSFMKHADYEHTDSYSPRLNLRYQINDHITVRGGWGLTEKLPTLGVLYPEPQYRDFSSFEKRFADQGVYLYYTEPYRMLYNPSLRWQRNRNIELGLDLRWGEFSLSLVGFFNRTTNPYRTTARYTPFSYRQTVLSDPSILPENPLFKADPQTGDLFFRNASDPMSGWQMLPSRQVRNFARNTIQDNGSPVDRRGLEFVLNFPMINPLRTQLRIDGAFHATRYINQGESQNLMAIYTGDQSFPYVGIYPDNGGSQSSTYNGMEAKRLNVNLTAVTHIPTIRLIVSLRLEACLMRRQQNLSEYDGQTYAFKVGATGTTPIEGSIYEGNSYTGMWPIAYIDLDGVRHPFTERERQDPRFESMMLRSTNIYQYRLMDYTPYFSANLSVTKEIGDHFSVSFYANNFTDARKMVYPYRGGVGAVFTPDFYYGLTVRVKF